MKITLLIKSLVGGGAEKVVVNLARGFQESGHEVSVVTFNGTASDVYSLAPNIERLDIRHLVDNANPLIRNWTLNFALRKTILNLKPNIVISFVHMVNIRAIIALSFTGVPLIVTEHTDPALSSLPTVWRVARRCLYNSARSVVGVSRGVINQFLWVRQRHLIYNPIAIETVKNENVPSERFTVGAMGRLHHAKGFDLLIEAFDKVRLAHPNCELLIYGEGSERAILEKKILALSLSDSVSLCGFTDTPLKKLSEMDLFVVSSRYEGFCLVLAEAMAAGVPCISFDCPSGPNEIITHEKDGFLVEPDNIEQLADAIDKLIRSPTMRRNFVSNGVRSSKKFALENIVKEWLELFIELGINNP